MLILRYLSLFTFVVVSTTEYTQSGNRRFLAYIPSWWKNQPWLVRIGGARPPPFTLFHSNKVAVSAPAERADTLTQFLLYPYMYSVVSTAALPLPLVPSLSLAWKMRGILRMGGGGGVLIYILFLRIRALHTNCRRLPHVVATIFFSLLYP
jgi:hypothetical protein